jgi:hypothetical protein
MILNREVIFEKPLRYINFVPFIRNFKGSSNQLGECIIKHHDLVSFAQRIV